MGVYPCGSAAQQHTEKTHTHDSHLVPTSPNTGYSLLRHREPVKAGRMIVPCRVAEINRAAGQRIGFHGYPDGIDQIRAGFDDDD